MEEKIRILKLVFIAFVAMVIFLSGYVTLYEIVHLTVLLSFGRKFEETNAKFLGYYYNDDSRCGYTVSYYNRFTQKM